jgi:hypothetical protein
MTTRKVGKRADKDFYPTPPWPTRGLFSVWSPPLGVDGYVYEPCAGDGAIVSVAREFGYPVQAFELREECGDVLLSSGAQSVVVGCDWLETLKAQPAGAFRAHALVTNPPFGLAFEIAEASWRAGFRSMALLLRLGFLASEARADWLQQYPPTQMVVLANRPSFTQEYLRLLELRGGRYTVRRRATGASVAIVDAEDGKGPPQEIPMGTDSYDYAWFIWERGADGHVLNGRSPLWLRKREYELPEEGDGSRPRQCARVLRLSDYCYGE